MLIMEGQNQKWMIQFLIHLMGQFWSTIIISEHVPPNNPNYVGANHYDAITKRNNLARQLYSELEEIAEQEAPSTYTPTPYILKSYPLALSCNRESAPRDV